MDRFVVLNMLSKYGFSGRDDVGNSLCKYR